MKTEEDSYLNDKLKRKENVYTCPEIQNEIIKIITLQVKRVVMKDLQSSPYLTVMADETTDSSNRGQVTFIIWWVTEDLVVHEEFLGLYHVEKIDSNTL